MADYSSLRLVRQGQVRVDFSCLPEKTDPLARPTVIG
jgi:hypothetical protein